MNGLDWREEKALVVEALGQLLPTLTQPYTSVPMGLRLSQMTGLPEKRCRTILGWLANEGHPHATRDGGTVKSFGRNVIRWRWHSTPVREIRRLREEKIKARQDAMGVIDTRDW